MLIDEIGKAYTFHSMDGTTGEVLINLTGNIIFKINAVIEGKSQVITLLDELVNFIPLFYFPLPKMEKEIWECIIMVDTSIICGLEPYQIESHFSKGRLFLTIDNLTYIFDMSDLMLSKKVLGESIYHSLVKQAQYITN